MSQTRFDKMVKLRDGRSIGIRRIREDDVPLIQDFHRLLGAESCRMFRAHPHTEEAVKTHVDRFVSGQDWGYLGIADDKAVAYFFLWSVGDNVPVLGICIADEYQNVGLGSELMDILINDAKLLGKDGIRLTTMLDNDRGFHLYLKKGFVYQGDVDNIFANGEIVTERDMFLPLKCTSTSRQSQISRVP